MSGPMDEITDSLPNPTNSAHAVTELSPAKRKFDQVEKKPHEHFDGRDEKRRRGTAPIKAEYLLETDGSENNDSKETGLAADDDAAEAFHHKDRAPNSNNKKQREKQSGQNKARQFGSSRDEVGLCSTRTLAPELKPDTCKFGDSCRFEHDLRKYLKDHKRADLTTFDGKCPVFEVQGWCPQGWKCRFVGSHSKVVPSEDGREGLELIGDEKKSLTAIASTEAECGIANAISVSDRINLTRKRFATPKSEVYLKWLNKIEGQTNDRTPKGRRDNRNGTSRVNDIPLNEGISRMKRDSKPDSEQLPGTTATLIKNENLQGEPKIEKELDLKSEPEVKQEAGAKIVLDVKQEQSVSPNIEASHQHGQRRNCSSPELKTQTNSHNDNKADHDRRANFIEPPMLPSEKRRLYFGPETPVLAPLTTQGNLPFRRLCSSLGASFTYSEMAMSLSLIQGQKSEWALIKAHESELSCPTFSSKDDPIVTEYGYNQSQDSKFGAQICANKPWLAVKATEVLTTLLPKGLRCIDLNCGCPIDLVYREGAGSALMDSPSKLDKMLRGMNLVSNATPITCKIRMGTRSDRPTAQKLIDRLVLGVSDSPNEELSTPCGVAAITLHGRSRQQRYTKQADWSYIASTAALIADLNRKADSLDSTIRAPDERDLPNGQGNSSSTARKSRAPTFFLGNGDIYSHEHYAEHIAHAGVDSCMIARGALMKPWIFEEIAANQYLDKSSTERLVYVEKFCRFGLEAWGSDEIGVGQTRRFLLEWLSFACRYIPVGLLEVLPPQMNDRPPRYKGRDELETLMASDNFRDWIKIRCVVILPSGETL